MALRLDDCRRRRGSAGAPANNLLSIVREEAFETEQTAVNKSGATLIGDPA